MPSKTRPVVITLVAGVFVLVVVTLIFSWRPIAVKYHKYGAKRDLAAALEKKSTSGQWITLDSDAIAYYEKHRDALVRLGHLQRKEFPLSYVSVPSLESRRLWEELQGTFPNHNDITMQGYGPADQDMIVVWEQPDKLPQWEKIIAAHDAPPTNILDAPQSNLEDILPFVGQWAYEGEDVCYIITQHAETLRIDAPPNDTWRTVLKNIRLEEKAISFDAFTYTDPNENYKFIIDNSGEHVFSGVRYHTVLKLNPQDSNQLLSSGFCVSKYGTYTDPNSYVLTKLK